MISKDDFTKKAISLYGDKYDFSSIPPYILYSTQELNIRCPMHGDFKRKCFLFLSGKSECPKCQNIKRRITNSEFISRSIDKHGNKYDYSKTNYNGTNDYVDIICKRHGVFSQMAYSHISGSGCPNCQESRGEEIIQRILKEMGVEYQRQKTFLGCGNGRLKFDFFIPSMNLCIEYDGKQHFEPVSLFGGLGGLEAIQKNDKIKNQFCDDSGIKLIRIGYKFNTYEKIKVELYRLMGVKESLILSFSRFNRKL